jgi:hypothetical protein
MCGRFARCILSRELERCFNVHPSNFEIQPNYNVAPTQEIPVIVLQEDERHIKKRTEVWCRSGRRTYLYRLQDDQRTSGDLIVKARLQSRLEASSVPDSRERVLPMQRKIREQTALLYLSALRRTFCICKPLRDSRGQGSTPGSRSLEVRHDYHHGCQ